MGRLSSTGPWEHQGVRFGHNLSLSTSRNLINLIKVTVRNLVCAAVHCSMFSEGFFLFCLFFPVYIVFIHVHQ